MSNTQSSMKGTSSLLILILAVILVVIGTYFYIDYQADEHANESMQHVVAEMKQQGYDIQYASVDSTPYSRSVTINKIAINADPKEPEVLIGKIVISGLSWQDLTESNEQLPLSMHIEIKDAMILIDSQVIDNDPNIQAFVDVMGHNISFASNIEYLFHEDNNNLDFSFAHGFADKFKLYGDATIGNAGWFRQLNQQSAEVNQNNISNLLTTTLNAMSFTLVNDGIIEQLRTISAQKADTTPEQITAQTIQELETIKGSITEYSPVYSLMVDELIKFTQEPSHITLRISPEKPLSSDDFIMMVMGGDEAPFQLMKKAKLIIEANNPIQ